MSRQLFALDVETRATDPNFQMASLEPWRVRQGKAEITSISICDEHSQVTSYHRSQFDTQEGFLQAVQLALEGLEGCNVYCHNGVFDVAFLIASLEKRRGFIPKCIRRINWYDTMLLVKWVINGQKAELMHFSYALVNIASNFCEDHPRIKEFQEMKSKPFNPNDTVYWEERNVLDVVFTMEIAKKFENEYLHEGQRPGYITEAMNLVPVANSWITGIKIDVVRLAEIRKEFETEMGGILDELNLPASMLTSPTQLGHYLFQVLKVQPASYTPKGAPSTAADDIKLIAFNLIQAGDEHNGRILNMIRRYKELSTLMSKYVKGAEEALQHTGDGYIYGAPRIFGTYTGRYTYSSKTLDTYKTSIALHQIPRKDKKVRSILLPPDGMRLYEADASGQESRLMAIRSGDVAMLNVFKNNLDFHTMTGATIIGKEYEDLLKVYKAGDARAIEDRQMGKLTNLSCNYRIGGKALAGKAFDDYDIFISIDFGTFLVNAFSRRYPGVPMYWDAVIKDSRAKGYTETFGGRRYKLSEWGGTWRWRTESSAINMPIQGSGAAMKNVAITEVFNKVEEAVFALDLHDATFYYVPEEIATEVGKRIDDTLQSIDYSKYWGFVPPIDLPYESKMGKSWAEVK